MDSSLRERFARLGPIRAVDLVSSGSPARLVLRTHPEGRNRKPVNAVLALVRRGMAMLIAKHAVEEALEGRPTVVTLPMVEHLATLRADLAESGFRADGIEDVTSELTATFKKERGAYDLLAMIVASELLSRETLSAALGEVSEYLVARLIGGKREPVGNVGFDVTGPQGERIEVKSRQIGKWKSGLQFNFGTGTASADEIYCVAWNDEVSPPAIELAYRGKASDFVELWRGKVGHKYSIRTTLKKLKASLQIAARKT